MDFYPHFKSRQEEMVHFLKEIVDRESPSTDKKAVDACSSYIINEYKKVGAKIIHFPQKETGDLYLVEYPPSSPKGKKERILLLTHVDTVWPVGKIKKMPFYISGNKAFGPGILDMKAGLVMAFYALKTLRELNIQPEKKIAVFMNSAEEIGSKASNDVIRSLSKKSSCVLCLEPAIPGGALKIQRKGRFLVHLKARGKAAHAGAPEEGINAIEELMLQLNRIHQLKTKEITVNIGLIQGGEKPNIVAEEAWAILDIRYWKTHQKEKIIRFLKHLNPIIQGARIEILTKNHTPPMEKTDASSNLLSQVRRIASSLNVKLEAGKTGGVSDASIASNMGIPTLDGLGPDGNGMHAEDEHLIISSLIERTALLTKILTKL